ncbi:MAG: hypothetical protein E7306_03635 [Butyrivibrio sp.]|jgi:hypothetical protein|nr:hypothetical protein [Butyrivibrio sp.]
MKVKCLRSFAGINFCGSAGEVKNFPDAVAKDLIKARYAEEFKPEPVATSQRKDEHTGEGEEKVKEPKAEKEVKDAGKRNNSRKSTGSSKGKARSVKQ